MGSLRLELHVDAFNQYRNGDDVVAAMEEIANSIRDRAAGEVLFNNDPENAPFTVTTRHNRTRAVTMVGTSSIDGELAEAINRSLTRALP